MCSTQVGDGSRNSTSTGGFAFGIAPLAPKVPPGQQQREGSRIRAQACSVLQVVALRWAPGAVLWGLMTCFLTLQCVLCSVREVLRDISWLSVCSVE